MTTNSNAHLIRKAGQHLIAIGIFIILSCIYFSPQFSGKQIQQSDIHQFQGMAHEVLQYEEETGIESLWTNSMFSGMPTYQITAWPGANKISWLENTLNVFIPRPAGYFIFAQIAFYIMLLLLGVNRWVAIPFAIAFAFTTNNIQLYEAGHTSKLRTLFSAPLVIGGLILTYQKKYLAGGIIFCAGLALNIFTNHIQITYYLALCLGILAIVEFVRAIKANRLAAFGTATAILAAGAILAVLANGHNLYSTYEYSSETMRGTPTLTQTTENPTSSSQTEGLAWDYAMQWSNGVPDILATLIPRGAGGSSSEPVPEKSEWHKNFGRQMSEAPIYWGPLPFTSGPAYFGASIWLLFMLGLFLLRGYLKWWLAGIVLLTMLLSMGKHFEGLTRLFFEYVPMYNKFRAPSSILTITALFIPILGALAASRFVENSDGNRMHFKYLIWSFALVGGFSLLMALTGTGFFDFTHANDARFAQNPQLSQLPGILMDDRKALFRADAFRSCIFAALATAVLFAVYRGWIKIKWLAGLLLAIIILIDLWGIDRRYIAPDDFIPKRQLESAFTPDAADQQILRDTDPHYRVHDLTTDAFQNSQRAYFHRMIGGYHAAKLQRYQDMIEYYLATGHEASLNMLNTRYFIVPGDENRPVVHRNPNALGNAWFVEDIRIVDSSDDEIAALENLNPDSVAIVHQDFAGIIQGLDPSKNGSITLTTYAPNKLEYQSSSTSEQLAVFSEVWYGPGKGWHLTIDGQPAELLRANYILRAARVPAGQHAIVMEFRPVKYHALKTAATIVSLLILGGMGYLIYGRIRAIREKEQQDSTAARGNTNIKSGKKPKQTRKR